MSNDRRYRMRQSLFLFHEKSHALELLNQRFFTVEKLYLFMGHSTMFQACINNNIGHCQSPDSTLTVVELDIRMTLLSANYPLTGT